MVHDGDERINGVFYTSQSARQERTLPPRQTLDIYPPAARPSKHGTYLALVAQDGIQVMRSAYWGTTPEYPIEQWLTSLAWDALPLKIQGWAHPPRT